MNANDPKPIKITIALSPEEMLDIIADGLRGRQKTEAACDEYGNALAKIEEAVWELRKRDLSKKRSENAE
jgi:hypothetical protein